MVMKDEAERARVGELSHPSKDLHFPSKDLKLPAQKKVLVVYDGDILKEGVHCNIKLALITFGCKCFSVTSDNLSMK